MWRSMQSPCQSLDPEPCRLFRVPACPQAEMQITAGRVEWPLDREGKRRQSLNTQHTGLQSFCYPEMVAEGQNHNGPGPCTQDPVSA